MPARTFVFSALVAALLAVPAPAHAQTYDAALLSGMQWRLLGPFRAGRSVAVAGVPGEPDHYYFGAVAGGVWETDNSGVTWHPIFDGQPIASIGAIAVAPSNPKVIYVGTGEADIRTDISYGDGVYRSDDGGKTWRHLGLDDTRRIGRVVIDPRNPDRVWVAALGHAFGPNEERGVFRSADGGHTWQKVLYRDENTGAIDLALDPSNANTIYAALWAARRPPWNVYPPSNGYGAVYKSTDGGDTWHELTGGIPGGAGVGRIGVAVAPSEPQRVYAQVDAEKGGVYRSDDGGATWKLMAGEDRIWHRGWYFGSVTVDPLHADVVYVMNTAAWRSEDGGQDVGGLQGRARRRRLPPALDQPERRPADDPGERPGHDRLGGRRRELELVEQPADRPVLPRHDRQSLPLPRLRRRAGQRRPRRRQPERLRRDLLPRLGQRLRGRRERLHRRRSRRTGARSTAPRTTGRSPAATRRPARAGTSRPRWRTRRASSRRCGRCRWSSPRPARTRSTSGTSTCGGRPTAARAGTRRAPSSRGRTRARRPTWTRPPPTTSRRSSARATTGASSTRSRPPPSTPGACGRAPTTG